MAVREIVFYPNDVLTTKTEPVEEVNDAVRELVQDLLDTMYDAPGVGLAAPQIGILKRVAVIDISGPDDPPDPKVLINPEVVERQGEITWEEGCLSFPKLYEKVDRASDVVVKALNEKGEEVTYEGDELLAVAMQHEIDHLDGKLFIDYLKPLRRQMITRKMVKLKKERARE